MIEDQDNGRTVTNDIHNIVTEIAKKKKVDPFQYIVIYKDTEGFWDGYNFRHKMFYPVRELHWLKAAIKTLNKYGN